MLNNLLELYSKVVVYNYPDHRFREKYFEALNKHFRDDAELMNKWIEYGFAHQFDGEGVVKAWNDYLAA